MISLLLSVTAVIAYFSGCLRLEELCCQRFLKCDLRSFGKGQKGYEAMYRQVGVWGLVKVYLPELLKIGLTVLIGGWLLSIKNHGDVGRVFALFCLLLGSLFPVTRRFVGRRGIPELCVGMLFVNPTAGVLVLVVFAAVTASTKYLSLAAVCASLAAILGTFVFVERHIAVLLAAFCAVLIILRHLGHLSRIIKHKEPKISTKRDLSYKFEEDF